MCNCNRPVEERLRTFKTHGQVGAVPSHTGEKPLPPEASALEVASLDDAAEIDHAVFHGLNTAVSAGIERQFGGVGQIGELSRGQTIVHLEGDPLMLILWPPVAAQVVLACRKKGRGCLIEPSIIERCPPLTCIRRLE